VTKSFSTTETISQGIVFYWHTLNNMHPLVTEIISSKCWRL